MRMRRWRGWACSTRCWPRASARPRGLRRPARRADRRAGAAGGAAAPRARRAHPAGGARGAGARWLAPARFEAPLLDADGGWPARAARSRTAFARAAGALDGARHRRGAGPLRPPASASGAAERHRPARLRAPTPWSAASPSSTWCGIARCGTATAGSFRARDGVLQHRRRTTRPRRGAAPEANLRDLFDAFVRVHPPARELMAAGSRSAR